MHQQTMWPFLKTVRTHPIYLREQGRWGEPNRYYATLLRYLPLVILAVLALGVCGYWQSAGLLGLSEGAGLFFALICIPNILMQMITWTGIIITPALTAPSIVEELHRGSWDILRLTPIPTMHIIVAKFLGALSRLKIWKLMLILSVIYGAGVGIGSSAVFFQGSNRLPLIWGFIAGVMTLIKPWLEIGFAGLSGLTLSLWTNSTRAALVGTYALTLFYRIVLGNIAMWGTVFTVGTLGLGYEDAAFAFGSMGVVLLYLISGVVLFFLMRKRALALDRGDFLMS